MLKIAVCDDEGTFLAEMTLKLNKLLPGCEIKTYLSGEALLNDGEPADIYFLDIQMGGIDGIKTARHEQAAKRLRMLREQVHKFFQ